jgi:hypothetical protein
MRIFHFHSIAQVFGNIFDKRGVHYEEEYPTGPGCLIFGCLNISHEWPWSRESRDLKIFLW